VKENALEDGGEDDLHGTSECAETNKRSNNRIPECRWPSSRGLPFRSGTPVLRGTTERVVNIDLVW
jgi:hypothetical protein